jgi:hypothetical protein
VKQFRIALFSSAALAAGIGFAVDFRPALVMRIDDGHPPADWRQVCARTSGVGNLCGQALAE